MGHIVAIEVDDTKTQFDTWKELNAIRGNYPGSKVANQESDKNSLNDLIAAVNTGPAFPDDDKGGSNED